MHNYKGWSFYAFVFQTVFYITFLLYNGCINGIVQNITPEFRYLIVFLDKFHHMVQVNNIVNSLISQYRAELTD